MLTYDFANIDGPIYEYIYKQIKADILSGALRSGEKLPSKRSFAQNNGISIITIQNAYDQLISEGYVYTKQKTGYYVADIVPVTSFVQKKEMQRDLRIPDVITLRYDLSNNGISPDSFPFSVWNRISRKIMTEKKEELMRVAPACGVLDLRVAIANHLKSFRGMIVNPNQIIVGAGTEYLYGLIVQLLGEGTVYAIENPGYKKLDKIYKSIGRKCCFVPIDQAGVKPEALESLGADVAHISPNHHFPTGITMPASRRYEVLSWANRNDRRYIIEDDYDSEFRAEGKPIPTMFSIDESDRVIYMNTFSKSLSPTIRISYMVLPFHLAERFYESMSFYSCTVSNFEQYSLAYFISQGHFEKHINRMRHYYIKQRKMAITIIENSTLGEMCEIIENDSGLHFLLKIRTNLSDKEATMRLEKRGIKLRAISEYYFADEAKQHQFILNYSNLKEQTLIETVDVIADELG